jgi:hypothetical protein
VRLAKRSGASHVLGEVGPTGLVMEPLGPATFDELFAVFSEKIAALAAESPDGLIFETFTDIAEIRCALLAARAVAPQVPVIASVTFGLDDIRRMPTERRSATIECAGNGRGRLELPITSGVQWGLGAVSTATWVGVPLAARENQRQHQADEGRKAHAAASFSRECQILCMKKRRYTRFTPIRAYLYAGTEAARYSGKCRPMEEHV